MAAIIILLGAPGAGKGTQAVRLAEARSLPHVSTGDLFRANVREGTRLGAQAQEYMNGGKLVPDELVLDMLFDRVAREDCSHGYILDGFPRTEAQAKALDERLETDPVVVDIQASDDTIVRRAAGRLVCKACGNVQHAEFDPPAEEGVCDACGGELHQREDDRPEVVRERLRVYHETTAPLVEFYREKGTLHSVDGEASPEKVFSEVEKAVSGG